jgi:hypothetical protein
VYGSDADLFNRSSPTVTKVVGVFVRFVRRFTDQVALLRRRIMLMVKLLALNQLFSKRCYHKLVVIDKLDVDKCLQPSRIKGSSRKQNPQLEAK